MDTTILAPMLKVPAYTNKRYCWRQDIHWTFCPKLPF